MTETVRPQLRSFFASVAAFKDGTDTPRLFLERCIETIDARESEIGAFVTTNLPAARTAADLSSARWASNKPWSMIDGMSARAFPAPTKCLFLVISTPRAVH